MTTYEIINPSDPYTLQSQDVKVAQIAGLFLGRGAYGLADEQGENVLPIFIFGGSEEWLKREFGDHSAWITNHYSDIATCLESVMIGGFSARRECEDALACMPEDKRADYLARRHDRMRSSLNDIGKAAQELAAAFRRKLAALVSP